MKSTKRALRRHHRERMIRHALRCLPHLREEDPAEPRPAVLYWYEHLKKCSCYLCGNPRKYGGGPTRQERRLMAAHRDDVSRQNGPDDEALPSDYIEPNCSEA